LLGVEVGVMHIFSIGPWLATSEWPFYDLDWPWCATSARWWCPACRRWPGPGGRSAPG